MISSTSGAVEVLNYILEEKFGESSIIPAEQENNIFGEYFGESSIIPAKQETILIEDYFGVSSIIPPLQVETVTKMAGDTEFGECSIRSGTIAVGWAMEILTEIIDELDFDLDFEFDFDCDFGNRVALDGVTSEGGSQVTFSDQDSRVPIGEREEESVGDNKDGVLIYKMRII